MNQESVQGCIDSEAQIADVRKLRFAALMLQNGKHWSHLPVDLKTEIFKLLDFPDLLAFRTQSQMDREVVDGLGLDFIRVELNNNKKVYFNEFSVEYMNRSAQPGTPKIATKTLPLDDFDGSYRNSIYLLAYVLKVGNIDTVTIDHSDDPRKLNDYLDVLRKSAPFKIKHLQIQARRESVFLFLENVVQDKIESLELDADGSECFPFEKIFGIPLFGTCKFVKIQSLVSIPAVSKLAEVWIERDSEIGTTLQTAVGKKGASFIGNFKKKFGERIVKSRESDIRIRTNNDGKHILLQLYHVDENDFIQCSVIPSDFKESDYCTGTSWCQYMTFRRDELEDMIEEMENETGEFDMAEEVVDNRWIRF